MRRCAGLAAAAALALAGCDRGPDFAGAERVQQPSERVAALLREGGCIYCHTIEGVRGAKGRVGPPLAQLRQRHLIAGQLPNTFENLTRFLLDPPALSPGSAMPRTLAREEDARAVAAFLYGFQPEVQAAADRHPLAPDRSR